MFDFTYLGYTFVPYGNIIGKNEQVRSERLMEGIDMKQTLLTRNEGYNYDDFYRIATEKEALADIYFVPEVNKCWIPCQGFVSYISTSSIRKHININKKHLKQII